MKTTVFFENFQAPYSEGENCHGGVGKFLLRDLIGGCQEPRFIKFIHDDIIPPGSTFGHHRHEAEAPLEEWYLCLSGEGIMSLDSEEFSMRPGDISCCFCGGMHGIRNTGKEDLRILVIYAAAI